MITIPKDRSETKEFKKSREKSSKGTYQPKMDSIMTENQEDDEMQLDGPKISSFWTEISMVPKSTEDAWVIPYNLEKNLYEYENVEIPKLIEEVLDREEFDRMMKQINTNQKIVSSSMRPHRKLVGIVLVAICMFFGVLFSDTIPREALLILVCVGFVLVILILNYIEEQKSSFGEVKRREISSILRQYECFTEKEVLIDFDVSDFGSYITVVRLQNTKKLSHVLERDGDLNQKGSSDAFANETIPSNKQITEAEINEAKKAQESLQVRKPEPYETVKPETSRPSLAEELRNLLASPELKQHSPPTPPISSRENADIPHAQFFRGAQVDDGLQETHARPASALDIGEWENPVGQ